MEFFLVLSRNGGALPQKWNKPEFIASTVKQVMKKMSKRRF
jgi:hypothetical protein